MKRVYLLFLAMSMALTALAQGVKISPSGGQPDPSAGLEVDFTNKGFLLPRITTVQRNAIVNPATGLQIYNTTTNCLEIYLSSQWQSVICQCNVFPSANFTYSPALPGLGQTVSFNAPASGVSYLWSFPSGSIPNSTAQNPTVSWSNAGTYWVVLQVTDLVSGCTALDSQQVTISNCPSGSQTFSATGSGASGSIQTFTVPSCVTQITVTARGAQGGNTNLYAGGMGAQLQGTFSVTGGEVIKILVGQKGENGSSGHGNCGAGGGGTFVTRNNNTPMLVAGGGGGAGTASSSVLGTPDPGQLGTSGSAGKGNGMPGGTGGNAAPGVCSSCGATNGAGLLTNSQAYGSSYGLAALAFINGGTGSTSSSGFDGGFGGGGAGAFGAGGAGGYSGGGSGNYTSTTDNSGGGGGGSFNAGTNPSSSVSVTPGNGEVIITW